MSKVKPKGMKNFAYNCYMNSLLQCFFYIPELRNYFINNINYFYRNKKKLSLTFAEIMYKYLKEEAETVDVFALLRFKNDMGEINNLFNAQGGDAKDLFINFIDTIINELTTENNDNNNADIPKPNSTDKRQIFLESQKEIDNNNIINKLFVGYYETIYKCKTYKNCARNSEDPEDIKDIKDIKTYSFTNEAFILFNLEKINDHYPNEELTVQKCLEYHFNREYKSNFYCNFCLKTENNDIEEKIYKPPNVLVLILDRGKGKTFKGNVDFDLEFDLKVFVDDESPYKDNAKYDLIGVLSHNGESSLKGHYTARCLVNGKSFYYFDDEKFDKANNRTFYSGEPYLLFYKRQES